MRVWRRQSGEPIPEKIRVSESAAFANNFRGAVAESFGIFPSEEQTEPGSPGIIGETGAAGELTTYPLPKHRTVAASMG